MSDATKPVSVMAVTAILAAAAPVASGLFAYIQGVHQQRLEREKDERSILRDYLSMVAGADRGKNDIPKVLRYIKETSEDPAIKQWAEGELDASTAEINALKQEQTTEQQKVDTLTKQIGEALNDAGVVATPPSPSVVHMRSELLSAQQKATAAMRKLDGPIATAAPAYSPDDVAPRGTFAQTDKKTSDGKPLFDFSVWLDMPSAMLSAVRDVSYNFRHPSFASPLYSNDPASSFRIRYYGWGCVESVDVTLTLKDGSRLTKSFNQCVVQSRAAP